MHGTENQNQARLIPKQATSLGNVGTEFCRLAALAAARPGAGVGGSGQAGEQGRMSRASFPLEQALTIHSEKGGGGLCLPPQWTGHFRSNVSPLGELGRSFQLRPCAQPRCTPRPLPHRASPPPSTPRPSRHRRSRDCGCPSADRRREVGVGEGKLVDAKYLLFGPEATHIFGETSCSCRDQNRYAV